MKMLGDPQDSFDVIHVAGTNGKGSVCAYLDSIMRAAGLRTGLFTSPYIERFEERIRVDGADIPPDSLLEMTLRVRDAASAVERELGEHPTEFELMFAVACMHFSRSRCDVAVVEVGLGGRLDATNIVSPACCVITRIGLDHTDLLGETIAQIAGEKSGIIKLGVPVVSWPQEPEAMRVIELACSENECDLIVPNFSRVASGAIDLRRGACSFGYDGAEYATGMLAAYQPYNAALAIEAAKCMFRSFGVPATSVQRFIEQGIAKAIWPGRFEVVSHDPLVIVDGAHNPQGAEALAESLRRILSAQLLGTQSGSQQADEARKSRITFVLGVLADKDYAGIIAPLLPLARRFVAYAPNNPRALCADDLAQAIREQMAERVAQKQAIREQEARGRVMQEQASDLPVEVIPSAYEATEAAVSAAASDDVIVACGSLYSIGEIKQALSDMGLS